MESHLQDPAQDPAQDDANGDARRAVELARAARDGDVDALRRHLGAGTSPNVSVRDRRGRRLTPLHLAADRGHAGIVRALLEAGAHPDARIGGGPPPWDRSPLHLAAAGGHLEVVRLLLDAGADTHLHDLHDLERGVRHTARSLAAERGHVEVARLLADAGAEMPFLDVPGAAESAGRFAHLRGLDLEHAVYAWGAQAPVTLLLDTDVSAASRALQRHESAQTWWRDVHGEEAELPHRAFAVLRLAGHRWTTIVSVVRDGPQPEESMARRLAESLGAPALRTVASGGNVGYAFFSADSRDDEGEAECLERLAWSRSTELDFESRIRDLEAREIGDPKAHAHAFVEERDAWAPHHLGPMGRPGETLRLDLGLEPREVERLDLVASW